MKLRSEPRVVSQGGDLVTRNLLYECESWKVIVNLQQVFQVKIICPLL